MLHFCRFQYLICFVLIALNVPLLHAQDSPYRLQNKLEYPLMIGGLVFAVTGNYLKETTPSLSDLEIQQLLSKRLPAFDRSAIYNRSEAADEASDVTAWSACFIMGTLFVSPKVRKNWKEQSILFLETALALESFTSMSKASFKRPRPYMYNPDVPSSSKKSSNGRHSFISGHTSHAAAGGFFFAKVFSDYYPNSKWKIPVWIVGAGLPAATGYLRYKAGNHFPSDVVAGYIVGGLIGWGIPQLHKQNKSTLSSRIKREWYTTGSGLGIRFTF